MKNITLIFVLLVSFVYGRDDIYFLPKDSVKFEKSLEKLIKKANFSIDIAVYNFQYQKIAKLLKKAAKDDIKVNIIFDNKKTQSKKSQDKKLCDQKNINCTIVKNKKQHIKLMIFDQKVAILGSLNLTKDSFKKNYEMVLITDDNKILDQINKKYQNLR